MEHVHEIYLIFDIKKHVRLIKEQPIFGDFVGFAQ
jgi:hypothetical protein